MSLRINLRGRIELSSAAESALDEIEHAFKEFEEYLGRGREKYGEEAAKLISKTIRDRFVEVVIASGRSLRAHDALLRLKNILAGKVGSKRIGVRRVFADLVEVRIGEEHVGKEKAEELLKGGRGSG